jgi:hypothetical protein
MEDGAVLLGVLRKLEDASGPEIRTLSSPLQFTVSLLASPFQAGRRRSGNLSARHGRWCP